MRRKRRRTLLLVTAGLCGLLLAYQGSILARIVWWRGHNPSGTSFMRGRLHDLAEKDPSAHLDWTWVPYDRISASLKRAVVATEDAKFTEHGGFDWDGIREAYEKNVRRGRIVAGGSTITQQLARNLFLSPRRTLWRKAEEALITAMLEAVMNKRRILEIYLNVVEWGERTYGAEAAARHYHGVAALDLDQWQSARLAAMIASPRSSERSGETAYLRRRTATILARMNQVRIP